MLEGAVTRRSFSLSWAMALAGVACAVGSPARAEDGHRAVVPLVERPRATRLGCSLIEPVCVHSAGTERVAPTVAAEALTAAERTLAFLRRSGLPRPLEDGALGSGPEFDVYLAPRATASRAYDDAASVLGPYDRTSAFAVVAAAHRGCELASDVARTIGQAALLGLDPGAHESTLGLGSSKLAAVVAPCPLLEAEALDRFQRNPERALVHATMNAFAGEALWVDYLDETYGQGVPTRLWSELVAIGGKRNETESFYWKSEPDVFDVLRRLFLGLGTNLDEVTLGFAIARAFVGSRSDGGHLIDTEHFGDFGRVRFDWSVPLTSLPRRLRTRAIEATGASYIWLDTAGATEAHSITVSAECEHAHAFRWALVTVDTEGRELGRHTGGRWGEDTTQLSLASLKDVAGVVVVGTTAGHDDREHAFDPEDGFISSAVCEVTLRRD